MINIRRNRVYLIMTIVAIALFTSACKKEVELAEMEVYEKQTEEGASVEGVISDEEQRGENAQSIQERNRENPSEITVDEQLMEDDLKDRAEKPIIPSVKRLSEVVTLPEKIREMRYEVAEKIDPTDEEIVLHAKLTMPVVPADPEKGAEMGDTALVSILAKDKNSGEDLGPLNREGQNAPLGAQIIDPKLEQKVVGMKVDQTKVVEIAYEADYFDAMLRGRTVEFTVKLLQLAQPMEPDEQDIESARTFLTENIAYNNQQRMYQELRNQIMEKTVITAYPQDVVDLLREEFRETIEDEEGLIETLQDNEQSPEAIREAEDLYVLENIEEKLTLLALSEKTGITQDTPAVIAYKDAYGLERVDDRTLFNIILQDILE